MILETNAPPDLVDALKKQEYHLVGKHSAVKRCGWFHETLTNGIPWLQTEILRNKDSPMHTDDADGFLLHTGVLVLLEGTKPRPPSSME